MHKNILTIVGITILFLGTCITPTVAIDNVKKSSIPLSNGNTLYVGGTGEGNYTRIQDAIDDASDGDTVFVYDDSSPYYENVIIDKSINLLGENKNTTIIDGNKIDDVIFISVNNVLISGFTIQNSGTGVWPDVQAGIEVDSINNIISENIITNNFHNVYLNEN